MGADYTRTTDRMIRPNSVLHWLSREQGREPRRLRGRVGKEKIALRLHWSSNVGTSQVLELIKDDEAGPGEYECGKFWESNFR